MLFVYVFDRCWCGAELKDMGALGVYLSDGTCSRTAMDIACRDRQEEDKGQDEDNRYCLDESEGRDAHTTAGDRFLVCLCVRCFAANFLIFRRCRV